MPTTRNLLDLARTLQTTALVGENIKAVKRKKKNLAELGVENIIGTELIKIQAQLSSYL
ncbi:MAG: hypothetical protein JSW08_00105 [archaeon]|nr:MAG: hypothetical protein JSW08_00105 [archaeon]